MASVRETAVATFLWVRGILSFAYMMIHTAYLHFVFGKPTNKFMAKEKSVFGAKTFRELWKWDFAVGLSAGRLQKGSFVPVNLKMYNMSSGSEENLAQYLESLYAAQKLRIAVLAEFMKSHYVILFCRPQKVTLSSKYADKANFVICYQYEAHALDRWDLEQNHEDGACAKSPKSMEDRINTAKSMVQKFNIKSHVIADTMTNDLMNAFASWPERLYVVTGTRIDYVGGPGPFWYNLDEIDSHLSQSTL